VASRCTNDPLYGPPAKITTVDKFQGQQNDIILLSLVKTRAAGHVRDIRRLVVAMSRARLGLYVFCRKDLFLNCYELTQTFNVLLENPTELQVLPNERTTDSLVADRKVGDKCAATAVKDVVQMGQIVQNLRETIQKQWEVYSKRVQEFEEKKRADAELVAKRSKEAEMARKQAAKEEQKELTAAKKAAEYAKQTEEFMEGTAKRVEAKEVADAAKMQEEVDE